MIQPVELADFFTVFFSAALVILFGALYALLFAYARVKAVPRLMHAAYAAYAGLFTSVLVLGDAANLYQNNFWTFIVVLMLVGYLLAPHGIWYLCTRTHEHEHEDESEVQARNLFQQP